MLNIRGLISLLCMIPASLLAQNLQVIKAEVDTPVLQELMGGCSLVCAFPWETKCLTPGKSSYPVYTLKDDDATTAWIDNRREGSIGTKLLFEFPKKIIRELRETPFYGFDLANGYVKSDSLWKSYSRVKKVRMSYNGKPLYFITFADSKRWQRVSFDDIFIKQGDSMSLEILEVFPGSKFPGVAITELVLQGAH